MTKTLTIDKYKIILEEVDFNESSVNNVDILDIENGTSINIKKLLKEYSLRNDLDYTKEVFTELVKLEDTRIKLMGFYNNCIIDIQTLMVECLMANR